jgi:hypothetical protein
MTRLDIDVILGYWKFVGLPDVIYKAYVFSSDKRLPARTREVRRKGNRYVVVKSYGKVVAVYRVLKTGQLKPTPRLPQ